MGYLETALVIWGECRGKKLSVLEKALDPYELNELNELSPTADPAAESDRPLSADRGQVTPAALVPSDPDPLDRLRGPRRTPWNTLVWSDPDAPPIELFGPV